MTLLETYNYLNTELADPRTNDWLTLSSPIYPLCIILLYLYTVCRAIPKFMQNRKAYQLKEFIIMYNIYQIVACSYVTYGLCTSGWKMHYIWSCQAVDTSDNPEALRTATLHWWETFIKTSEFIETMVYAFRKKHNQISFLHVYHHITTYVIIWIGAKYFPGGSYAFPPILNNSVHVIMYTYYLLTQLKIPGLQKMLTNFKPYMTIIQMTQISLLILYAAQSLRSNCEMSKLMFYIFLPNVIIVWYLFYKFYQKTFLTKNKGT